MSGNGNSPAKFPAGRALVSFGAGCCVTGACMAGLAALMAQQGLSGALFVFLLLCFGLLSGSPLQEMQLVRFGVTLLFGCIGGVLGMLRSERKRRV